MITNFEKYKLNENFDYQEVNLLHLVDGKRKRDIEKILKDKLIGTYVNFESKDDRYENGRHIYATRLHNGFIEDLRYELVRKIVHIKLRNDDRSISIPINTNIKINLTLTSADKYNL